MFQAALRRSYPMMVSVRRVVADELLMATLEFGHPIATLVHVKVDDLSQDAGRRRWRGRHVFSLRARIDGGCFIPHSGRAGQQDAGATGQRPTEGGPARCWRYLVGGFRGGGDWRYLAGMFAGRAGADLPPIRSTAA